MIRKQRCFLSVALVLSVCARAAAQNPCTDLLEAVVKIQSGGQTGAGVIASVEPARVVVVTAGHVVKGTSAIDVWFYGAQNRAFSASRLLVTPELDDDLAVLAVPVTQDFTKAQVFPIVVSRKSDDVVIGEKVTTIGHMTDTNWKCVAQMNSVTALTRGTDARVLTATPLGIGDGNSGGPLFDSFGQMLGLVTRTGGGLGGDVLTTKIEGVKNALKKVGVTPNRLVDRRAAEPPPGPPPGPNVDSEALDIAQRFLQFLARNQISQAYGMLSPTTKGSIGVAQFVTIYTQYVAGMAGRELQRKLSASLRLSSFQAPTGPVQAETYVLTFTTTDPKQPGPTVFEMVTTAKEQNHWGIVQFTWNTVSSGAPAGTPAATLTDPEQVARQALAMIHRNELSTAYRDFVSDLQKRTGLTTEGAFAALCSVAVGKYPGSPSNLTLISKRPYDTIPQFFGSLKAEFLMLVFLANYQSGDIHEELYMVKEAGLWKIAAFMIRPVL